MTRENFTWPFIGVLVASGVFFCGMIYWAVQMREHDRRVITAFCQPRGYVGGAVVKYVGSVCIDKDGNEMSITGILRTEGKR